MHSSLDKIKSFLPILIWLRKYNKNDFYKDAFAGLITAILFVPQGMAYAMLAGLPVETGLYASLLPPLLYAFFGTSTTMSVGPVSVAAIMIASVLSAPEIQALGDPTQNAVILAAEGGLILLLMSLLRMGGLVNFISHTVLTGFTSGAAILIVFSQLPHLLGLSSNSCGFSLTCYYQEVSQISIYSALIGMLSLLVLLFMAGPFAKILKNFQIHNNLKTALIKSAPLLVVVLATLTVITLELSTQYGVSIVGEIPKGLPSINFNFLSLESNRWITLLPSAALISLIAYVESVAIAKVVGNLRNEKINPNQEFVALGASNIASAMSGGVPVAGGFSRTMVNFSAGAQTQLAMIIAVVLLGVSILSFSNEFAFIPEAALSAIILVAIFPLIKLKSVVETWKYDRAEGLAQIITLAGVLIFGIEEGIALGFICTIISLLRRTSRPHIAVVGRIKNSEQFRNVERHQVEIWDNISLIRIDDNITFSNVTYITEFIENTINKNPTVKDVVLIFSSVSYVDTTSLEMLEGLIVTQKPKGIVFHLAEIKGPVMDKLEGTDFINHLKPGHIFFCTSDAIEKLLNTNIIPTDDCVQNIT